MPLDDFISVPRFEPYAQNRLVQPCMESAGYRWDVPYKDLNSNNGPSWNEVDRKLFNTSLASSFGYHDAPAEDSTAEAWEAFATDVTEDEDAQFVDCLREANRALDAPDDREQLAGQLEGVAYDAALESDPVVRSAKKWHQCMLPLGLSDLPDRPHLMPSPSQSERFRLDTTEKPSVNEVDEAVFDARCQESTGYIQALYNEEWERQIPLLAENADDLNRVRLQNDSYVTRIQEAINSNAPKR